MQNLRVNILPYAVIALGFALSIALALAPLQFLIVSIMPDDAFYYFEIARNIVHGLGSTFDGVDLTNGYHPLWMLTLLPIFKIFSVGGTFDMTPIHVALVVSAFLNAALGFVLLAIVSRYTQNTWVKTASLAVWFLNPFNLYGMVSGLETPLSIFLMALFILCALRASEREDTSRFAILGIVGGLMMLGRLDNVFYFLMFFVWLIYKKGLRASLRQAMYVIIAATIVVLPWLVWNALYFHMFLTSASEASTIVDHHQIAHDQGAGIFQTIKASLFFADTAMRRLALQMGAPSIFFVLFGLMIGWWLFAGEKIQDLRRAIPLEVFIAGGFLLNFIANTMIRWSTPTWYLVPFNVFLALWIAWLLERIRVRVHVRKDITVVIVCLTLALFYIGWSKTLAKGGQWASAIIATVEWTNANVPQGATIGAFNSGMMGYFSNDRVVNLDGLVDNEAFDAIKSRTLWNFIQAKHIEYIADSASYYQNRFGYYFGVPNILDNLTLIHDESGIVQVYKEK